MFADPPDERLAPGLPTRDEAWTRLHEISVDLTAHYRELYGVLADELRAKVEARATSIEGSAAGREQDATAGALDYSLHVLDVKGHIAALEHEHDFLVGLLGSMGGRFPNRYVIPAA